MSRTTSTMILIAALAAFAGGSAAAADAYVYVPPTSAIEDFFAERGVEATWLGQSKSEVPAAQWSRLIAIVRAADDITSSGEDYGILNRLAYSALVAAGAREENPMRMKIGDTVWAIGEDYSE